MAKNSYLGRGEMSIYSSLISSIIFLFLVAPTVFTQNLVIDDGFAPTINNAVTLIEIQSDQKILIGGTFSSVNGVTRQKIARLNTDGSLDTSFDAGSVVDSGSSVTSMKILPDGKILLSGYFGIVGMNMGQFKSVARLNSDGTLDNTFTSFPYVMGGSVKKAEVLASGKILICGDFSSPNGNSRFWLARYNSDGSYDSSFTTEINGSCEDIEVQPDGKYLIAGLYTTVNGGTKKGLARFNTDDGLDTGFSVALNQNGNISYYGIELQSNGKIIGFQIDLPFGRRLVRLNADGSTQLTFPVDTNFTYDVDFQADGKPIVAGNFNNPSTLSNQFNRFNTDGTFDLTMNKLNFCCNYPRSVAVQTDGKIIVGGSFETINGMSKPNIVRLTPEAIQRNTRFDFDGDGKADIALFRPSDRVWYLNRSTAGFLATQFGLSDDKPVVADYDGDGTADIAVFRDGVWYYLRSADFSFGFRSFGQAGDIPQPGDYDGDGKADFAVFRPTESPARWYVQASTQGFSSDSIGLELSTDKPVADDFDGDGKTDLAVFRDGNWFYKHSSNQTITHYQFGLAGDKPVLGDFDGDGRSDYAVFRPSNRVWYVQKTTDGFYAVNWGLPDDLPVPADYDGDGKTDIAVYRDGIWYQFRSNGNAFYAEQFGLAGDIPAQLR